MPAKPPKVRLDQYLVDVGLCVNKSQAQRQILAGQVKIDGQVVDKAGTLVQPQAMEKAQLAVGPAHPYVSRGGLKLAKALAIFGVSPAGRVCLDVGASTGGFTDCLLQQGASRVYAVDVGHGQLDWRLRQDPRVVVLEKTNIRMLDSTALSPDITLATVDVSFISLKKVLPTMVTLMAPTTAPEIASTTADVSAAERHILALLKPQFEYKDYFAFQKGFTGVVSDPEEHREIITGMLQALPDLLPGWEMQGLTFSPITGPKGNIEFLLHLKALTAVASKPETSNMASALISADMIQQVLDESQRLRHEA